MKRFNVRVGGSKGLITHGKSVFVAKAITFTQTD